MMNIFLTRLMRWKKNREDENNFELSETNIWSSSSATPARSTSTQMMLSWAMSKYLQGWGFQRISGKFLPVLGTPSVSIFSALLYDTCRLWWDLPTPLFLQEGKPNSQPLLTGHAPAHGGSCLICFSESTFILEQKAEAQTSDRGS